GLLVRQVPQQPEQMRLRFVERRPVSRETTTFLAWCSARWAAQGVRAVLLLWDNASWYISAAVRTWLREHNRRAKQTGQGMRIVACRLPSKSPWLNPIEPKWVYWEAGDCRTGPVAQCAGGDRPGPCLLWVC